MISGKNVRSNNELMCLVHSLSSNTLIATSIDARQKPFFEVLVYVGHVDSRHIGRGCLVLWLCE